MDGDGWRQTCGSKRASDSCGLMIDLIACTIKILGSEVLWCIFGTLVQGWHKAWCNMESCSGKVQKRDV